MLIPNVKLSGVEINEKACKEVCKNKLISFISKMKKLHQHVNIRREVIWNSPKINMTTYLSIIPMTFSMDYSF